jgi:hypothetical protein
MSGGGGGGTSTTTQSIPAELKPLASAYTSKAINLGEQGFNPYTSDRFAGLNPDQLSAINAIRNRAISGSATMNNAESALNANIAGGPNPYLDSMVNQAQGSVMRNYQNTAIPQLLGGSMASGSFGNTGITAAGRESENDLQQNLGNIATQMYGGAYDSDKARQMQAIGMAPMFGNAAYSDASQLMNAGQIMQDQSQRGMDFDYEQFLNEQNLPYKQLAAMSGVFGSNLGSSSTTQQSGGGK